MINSIPYNYSTQVNYNLESNVPKTNLYSDEVKSFSLIDMRNSKEQAKSLSILTTEIEKTSTFYAKINGKNTTRESLLEPLKSKHLSNPDKLLLLKGAELALTALIKSGLRLEIINNKPSPVDLNEYQISNIFNMVEKLLGLESKDSTTLLSRADAIREKRNEVEKSGEFLITQENIDSETKNHPETLLSVDLINMSECYYKSLDRDLNKLSNISDIDLLTIEYKNILNDAVTEIKNKSESNFCFISAAKNQTKLIEDPMSSSPNDFFCLDNVESKDEVLLKRFRESACTASNRYFSNGYQPMLPGTGVNFQARPQHKGIPFNFMMRSNSLDDKNVRLTAMQNSVDLRVGRLQNRYSKTELASLVKTASAIQKLIDFGAERNLCMEL